LNEDGDDGGGCEGVSMVLRWRWWLLETLFSIFQRTQRKKKWTFWVLLYLGVVREDGTMKGWFEKCDE